MLVPITLITKIPIQNHNNNLVLTANLKWRCNNNKNQWLIIPRNKRRAMIKLKCIKTSTTRSWSQRTLAAITIEFPPKKWTRLTLTKKVGILCRIEMTKATKNPYAKWICRLKRDWPKPKNIKSTNCNKTRSNSKKVKPSRKCRSAPSAQESRFPNKQKNITKSWKSVPSTVPKTSSSPKRTRPSKKRVKAKFPVTMRCAKRSSCQKAARELWETPVRINLRPLTNQSLKLPFCSVIIMGHKTKVKHGAEGVRSVREKMIVVGHVIFLLVITIWEIWVEVKYHSWTHLTVVSWARTEVQTAKDCSHLPSMISLAWWALVTSKQHSTCFINKLRTSNKGNKSRYTKQIEPLTKLRIKELWKTSTIAATPF